MRYEVQTGYTEALMVTAARRFIMKALGWNRPTLPVLLVAAFFIVLGRGGPRWAIWTLGVVLGLGALTMLRTWTAAGRRARDAFRRRKSPSITFVFDDTGVTTISEAATGAVPWSAIQRLWCFPEVWLLFVGGVYTVVPADALSPEVRAFILGKAREHGCRLHTQNGT